MRDLRLVAAGMATAGLFAGAWGGMSWAGASWGGAPATTAAVPAGPAAHAQASDLASFRAASTHATVLKTRKIHGVRVLTSASGRTLYWFAPDTSNASKCNGSCAQIWPPVPGPAHGGAGVTGKLSTIKRSDGATQATYRGHPLYTYTGDTKPGQNKGNGLDVNGGIWHEVTASGSAASGAKPSSSSSGGGYGY